MWVLERSWASLTHNSLSLWWTRPVSRAASPGLDRLLQRIKDEVGTQRRRQALVRGCGQAYALQTVEPVTYRCGTRRVCQARSSGSERYTRARPHAVAPGGSWDRLATCRRRSSKHSTISRLRWSDSTNSVSDDPGTVHSDVDADMWDQFSHRPARTEVA